MTEEVLEQQEEKDDATAAARGYARVSGEEQAAPEESAAAEPAAAEASTETPTAEVETPKTETPAAPEAPKVDVQALKAELMAELKNELTPTLRKLGGDIGGLKDALTAAKKAAAAGGEKAPTDERVAAAAEDPEEWKKLREDFPEFSAGVENFVAAQVTAARSKQQPTVDPEAIRSQVLQELTPQFEKQIGKVREETREQTLKESRAYARIDREVGDGWEATMRTPEFGAWFSKLPAEKQQQYDSFNAPDVIACLKEFGTHQDAAKTRQAKTERLAAATQVQSTGGGGPPILTDEDAAKRGYERVARR